MRRALTRRRLITALVSLIVLTLVALAVTSRHSKTTHLAAVGPDSTTTTVPTATTFAPSTTALETSTTAPSTPTSGVPSARSTPRDTTPSTDAPVDTVAEVPSRARGRVLDESGNPVAGMHVILTTLSTGDSEPALTDQDGSYDVACSPQPGVTFSLMIASQAITNSPGEWPLRYAYQFVGGSDDPSSAPPVQCMTSSEPPIVTVVHPGGVVTGHEFHNNGDPFPASPDGFRGMHVHHLSCGTPCRNIDFIGRVVGNEYEIVGLAPGDYELRADMESPITFHIEAGETTVQDWTSSF